MGLSLTKLKETGGSYGVLLERAILQETPCVHLSGSSFSPSLVSLWVLLHKYDGSMGPVWKCVGKGMM